MPPDRPSLGAAACPRTATEKPLADRRAVVTGSVGGIGLATAQLLAARGASVIINGKDECQQADAEAAVGTIRQAGGTADFIIADVSHTAAIRFLFARAVEIMGGLDIVVSNAGGDAVIRTIAETTEEDYDRVMALNARGQFFVMQEAARCVADNGRIVVLSSSTVASPYPGSASYSGAKRAAELYAQVLAAELGERNITVNVVSPGPTDTPAMRAQNSEARKAHVVSITPLGRFGQPDDIAEAIAFLASDDSSWVTRQIIQVGGGIV